MKTVAEIGFTLRQKRNHPNTLELVSPAYPGGEAIATCSLLWVAEEIVRRWAAFEEPEPVIDHAP